MKLTKRVVVAAREYVRDLPLICVRVRVICEEAKTGVHLGDASPVVRRETWVTLQCKQSSILRQRKKRESNLYYTRMNDLFQSKLVEFDVEGSVKRECANFAVDFVLAYGVDHQRLTVERCRYWGHGLVERKHGNNTEWRLWRSVNALNACDYLLSVTIRDQRILAWYLACSTLYIVFRQAVTVHGDVTLVCGRHECCLVFTVLQTERVAELVSGYLEDVVRYNRKKL